MGTCHPFVLDLAPELLGVTADDQEWLRSMSVPLDGELDDAELADAEWRIPTHRPLRRLGVVLADIDTLRREIATAWRDPSGRGEARRAVIEAICSADLFGLDSDPNALAELARHYGDFGPFGDDEIRRAVDWACRPPHHHGLPIARWDGEVKTTQLTDAIRGELFSVHQPALTLDLGAKEHFRAGLSHHHLGLHATAEAWWRKAADLGHTDAT